ncbi:NAD(P)-dependent oxidoreductase [Synechococcus sp. MU1617]|uniref:NAD(P)-dependent oxidoreductase n=1 Tax=Synechococcus sp. MU1617 TaxID=2508346 RepID=UPI001CF820E0|nr:NAD(P)-dependent oxidoreductase [Synechococcus sp. MU1617]MCB4389109.1 NAD(P)-dependent oxidoreductase [Synechococcus sp. MU1617]
MTRSDWRIGMVGLGALGLPIAVNLRQASLNLQVHTRSRRAENDPQLKGTRPCGSPAAAAENVDVLMLCVSDDTAVNNVLFGPDGAAERLQPGSIVIDCSTISPTGAQQAAIQLQQIGVHYLDAPVTGGTEGARAGTLTVLVGGNADVLKTVRPLLEVIGGSIHYMGPVGRGQQAKAVNQVLVAGSYAAVAEAIALGQRLELPMQQVIDALKSGAAGSWALNHRSEAMLQGRYPLGFKLSLHHKDLGIALEAATSVELDMPITALVEQLESELIRRGFGDDDVSALHRLNTANNGA